jgi:hypothetical protein
MPVRSLSPRVLTAVCASGATRPIPLPWALPVRRWRTHVRRLMSEDRITHPMIRFRRALGTHCMGAGPGPLSREDRQVQQRARVHTLFPRRGREGRTQAGRAPVFRSAWLQQGKGVAVRCRRVQRMQKGLRLQQRQRYGDPQPFARNRQLGPGSPAHSIHTAYFIRKARRNGA